MKKFQEISPIEVNKLNQESGGLRIIDVRSKEEYEALHSVLAIHLPLDSVNSETVSSLGFSRDDAVYLICRSGARSAKACELLAAEGFTCVFNVVGGTTAWAESGLPVYRSTKGSY